MIVMNLGPHLPDVMWKSIIPLSLSFLSFLLNFVIVLSCHRLLVAEVMPPFNLNVCLELHTPYLKLWKPANHKSSALLNDIAPIITPIIAPNLKKYISKTLIVNKHISRLGTTNLSTFILKGSFTIFLFSVRSHILNRNGVWYTWFCPEGPINASNSNTPLLFKIWDLTKNKKIVNDPFIKEKNDAWRHWRGPWGN